MHGRTFALSLVGGRGGFEDFWRPIQWDNLKQVNIPGIFLGGEGGGLGRVGGINSFEIDWYFIFTFTWTTWKSTFFSQKLQRAQAIPVHFNHLIDKNTRGIYCEGVAKQIMIIIAFMLEKSHVGVISQNQDIFYNIRAISCVLIVREP